MSPFFTPKGLGASEAGFFQPASSSPAIPSYLLLEDGSNLLLESGTTDKLILEG